MEFTAIPASILLQRFRNIFSGSNHDSNSSTDPAQFTPDTERNHSLSTESQVDEVLSDDPSRRTGVGSSRDSLENFIRRMRSIRQSRMRSRPVAGNPVYLSTLELSESGPVSGLPPLSGRTRHLRLSPDDGSERRHRRPRSRNNSGESLSPLNDPLRDPHDIQPTIV